MKGSPTLKFFLLVILIFGVLPYSFSQEKIERESRIQSKEVPSKAKEWLIDSFEKVRKPKWYLEYSQNGKSYEAKFHYLGHFHSVEFDSVGKVEDVEIEISQSEVSSEIWKEINKYFKETYEQVKVEKIQRQFTGSESDLEDFFDEEEEEGITTRYEIVFQGKQGRWELWEGLFDVSGKFISKMKVQIRLNDNLVF